MLDNERRLEIFYSYVAPTVGEGEVIYALEIGEVLGCKSEARCLRGKGEGEVVVKEGTRGRNVTLP